MRSGWRSALSPAPGPARSGTKLAGSTRWRCITWAGARKPSENTSGWQTARSVTLPGALPHAFTGIRIASSATVITALVAEYFGGPVSGVGNAITTAVSSSNYALAWAYVLGSILTGLVFYSIATLLEVAVTRRRTMT